MLYYLFYHFLICVNEFRIQFKMFCGCLARNSHLFLGLPDVPRRCDELNTTANTSVVSCLPGFDGGEPLDFSVYKSEVTRPPEETRSTFTMDEGLAIITVSDLSPKTNYTLMIYQKNSFGKSHESFGVLVWTQGNLWYPQRPCIILLSKVTKISFYDNIPLYDIPILVSAMLFISYIVKLLFLNRYQFLVPTVSLF